MVRDAESHAEEDRRLKELAEARNTAEQVVYSTEKSLAEHEDQARRGDKADIRAKIDAVQQALDGRRRRRDPVAAGGAARGLVQARRAGLPAGPAGPATPAGGGRRRRRRGDVGRRGDRRRRGRGREPVTARERANPARARRPDATEARRSAPEEAGETSRSSTRRRARAEEYLNDLRRRRGRLRQLPQARRPRLRGAGRRGRPSRSCGELLPVLDNLERALDASEHHEEAKVAEGVQLRAASSWPTCCTGAASSRSRPSRATSSTRTSTRPSPISRPSIPRAPIAAVWQRGYRLGDRVVRPARVVVSSGPATEGEE